MTVFETIEKRKSIRKYSSDPVEREKLEKILEAGRLAPSAVNAQSWHFVMIEEPGLQKKMAEACDWQPFMSEAPCSLVVWADKSRDMLCGQSTSTVDCSIAMSFMILEATELGLGTCWLGHFYADKVKEFLGLPENAEVVAVTPVGYPDENPAPRPRKPFDEIAVIR